MYHHEPGVLQVDRKILTSNHMGEQEPWKIDFVGGGLSPLRSMVKLGNHETPKLSGF